MSKCQNLPPHTSNSHTATSTANPPRPGMCLACPCSTSVNITPLQRPVVPPRGSGHTAHRTEERASHTPIPATSGTNERNAGSTTQLLWSLAWHGMSMRHRKRLVDITPTYRTPVTPRRDSSFHFRENPWHSDARSSRTSHVGTRISRSTFGLP